VARALLSGSAPAPPVLARLARPWRRAAPLTCEQVREALPEVLDNGALPPGGLVAHVEYCLACQADLARYRKLLRLLAQLRPGEEVVVPAGIVADVLSAIESAASRSAVRSLLTGRRLAYAGAIAAAGAAGTGLVLLTLGRSRAGVAGRAAQSAGA